MSFMETIVVGGMGTAVLAGLVAKARSLFPVAKDEVRLFSREQRYEMFARAGYRCEHKTLLGRRCTSVPTAGDHVYPHSRGGMTIMSNSQALCKPCNSSKSARVPTTVELWLLARRRLRYPTWPADVDPRVNWKAQIEGTEGQRRAVSLRKDRLL